MQTAGKEGSEVFFLEESSEVTLTSVESPFRETVPLGTGKGELEEVSTGGFQQDC